MDLSWECQTLQVFRGDGWASSVFNKSRYLNFLTEMPQP
jgi:hypothetical protein